jgi:hypothetical protein
MAVNMKKAVFWVVAALQPRRQSSSTKMNIAYGAEKHIYSQAVGYDECDFTLAKFFSPET